MSNVEMGRFVSLKLSADFGELPVDVRDEFDEFFEDVGAEALIVLRGFGQVVDEPDHDFMQGGKVEGEEGAHLAIFFDFLL